MFTFKNFIFQSLFPVYFKENDSYKDSDGKGLLERYMENFGAELDEFFIPQIRDYLNIIDPLITDGRFLNAIAYTLGNPPDITLNESDYRKLLSYVVDIYKVKGTKLSYELLFNLLGLKVTITEIYIDDVIYDNNLLYDTISKYDTFCESCSKYKIHYGDYFESCKPGSIGFLETVILPEVINKIIEVIHFIEPINAKLDSLYREYEICETYERFKNESDTIINDIKDSLIICTYLPMIYDNSLIYDNDVKYDNTEGYNCIYIEDNLSTQFDDSFNPSFG